MGDPISGPFSFRTRQYYDINGDPNVAKDSILSFEDLDTTLLSLSSSIANVNPVVNINTGSLLLTASADLNVITFTKGDGITQFTITVDTGSGQTYTEGNGINIDGSNVVSAELGDGLDFDGNKIRALVRKVNGSDPVNGNVTVNLTAVLTGPSASLIASSSGTNTGSITNATVWVVSGDGGTPSPNGLAYIFVSQSTDAGGFGKWFALSTLNQDQADLRYVELSSATTQDITSSLLIRGSTTFSGSLFWSGSSNADGATANVVVLSNGQLYITGAYGAGGGGTPSAPLNSVQFNNNSNFGGDSTLTFTPPTASNLASPISSSLLNLFGRETISGSLILRNPATFTTYNTSSWTSSLTLQVIGTSSFTGSLIVSSSSNVIGTSRVTGSLIVSNSLQVIGTGSITGSLVVSRSIDNTATIVGSGSTNPILNVLGSQGQLFSVYDTLTGSLFSVNDISGLPILEVKSDTTTLIGSYQAPALHTSRRIVTVVGNNIIDNGIPTASYNAAIIDYNLTSASCAKVGSIMTAWSGSSISTQTEYATASFGSVNFPTMSLQISGANLIITASAAAASWVIKTIIRSI
jgi:hypothetical protein